MKKQCSKCKQFLSISNFQKRSWSRDGFRPSCKQCDKTPIKSGGKTQKIIENLPKGYKRCTKCNIIKPYDEYHKNRFTKDGLTSKCKNCRCKHYREDPQSKIRYKTYIKNNKEKIKQKRKAYYLEHKEEIRQKYKEYTKLPENKAKRNYKRNNKRKHDIKFRLECNLRDRLRKTVKNVTKGIKVGSFVRDLGCTLEELKNHLENQFQPGMTWENWGFGDDKWHIDHIKPLHMFDLTDREQFLEVCNYTNLRPLWQKDNLTRTYEEFEKGIVLCQ